MWPSCTIFFKKEIKPRVILLKKEMIFRSDRKNIVFLLEKF